MKDFRLSDSTNDLRISGGDFQTIESDNQHVQDIIENPVGSYKQDILVGVGAMQYLSGSKTKLEYAIKRQLKNDGYSLSELFTQYDQNGQLEIYTNAKRN